MKRFLIALSLVSFSLCHITAQELYVNSEPASNMPAQLWSLRQTNMLMRMHESTWLRNELQLRYGINKRLMAEAAVFSSNAWHSGYGFDNLNLYTKYRFITVDGTHKHFRMATFGTLALGKNKRHTFEKNIAGDNTGWNAGIIATQLLHKLAISTTATFLKPKQTDAIPTLWMGQYNIAVGYLIFPKTYSDYKQTNINLYAEMLMQQIKTKPSQYFTIDIAPAIQFIINSKIRCDLSYKYRMLDTAPDSHVWYNLLARVEWNFIR